MESDSAEIKPAQCCIKFVFHLTYCFLMLYFLVHVVQTSVRHMVSEPLECYNSGFVVCFAVHHIG